MSEMLERQLEAEASASRHGLVAVHQSNDESGFLWVLMAPEEALVAQDMRDDGAPESAVYSYTAARSLPAWVVERWVAGVIPGYPFGKPAGIARRLGL